VPSLYISEAGCKRNLLTLSTPENHISEGRGSENLREEIIDFLDVTHRLVSLLKNNVSETGKK
jgi:hypothetical protein